jgi:hypothetical protein
VEYHVKNSDQEGNTGECAPKPKMETKAYLGKSKQ